MSYDSEIKRVLKVTQGENDNTNDVKNLGDTDRILSPESFTKNLLTVNLLVGYICPAGTIPAGFSPTGSADKTVLWIQGGPNNVQRVPNGTGTGGDNNY